MQNKFKFIIVLMALCVFTVGVYARNIRRAFFDIGSGTTKMIIADVDTRTGTVKVIHEEEKPVAYKKDLEVSKSEEFSQGIMDRGIVVLANMKWLALDKGAKQFAGVATSAFRTAKNGEKYADFITKVLGIRVSVIDQEYEAKLGFLAAVRDEKISNYNIVVWDIGGGSMQMTTMDKNGEFTYYLGDLASESFAAYIIEKIQGKTLQMTDSPNPITRAQMSRAIKYAGKKAREIPKEIRKKLRNSKTVIIGIGGVHYYSIRNQVKMKKDSYTRKELGIKTYRRTGKTDKQIGGDYARTDVSNLALVYGFMDELKMRSIKTKKINIAHGMLLHSKFWN